jgi:ubiquinone/menaquinone biosynthesis C-methylase UbiE
MTSIVPESVPSRSHYSSTYFRGGRIFSYGHQIDTVLSFEPRDVLEIGVGAGVVAAALRATGISVTTLDIQPDLNPDLVGSVAAIPAADEQFDVATCCQVLEHLPFDQFEVSLRELHRVTRRGVVLSLPDLTSHYYMCLRLPRIGTTQWVGTRKRSISAELMRRKWEADGHHWEIGYTDQPLKLILRTIEACGWSIARTWRVLEKHHHRFFELHRGSVGARS